MTRNPDFFITHIAESLELIESYIEGRNKEEFLTSVGLQDMILRRLEIIGEAVKNLPRDFCEIHPGIPWKKLAGLRDVLIHHYFGIDTELVWIVLTRELPPLKTQIDEIRKTSD
jgi:uncharacterized protein with HEPN domain